MLDVVYPVRFGESNESLRYSLRSLARFGKNIRRVWLVGYAPSWVTNVECIRLEQTADKWLNTRHNIETACRCGLISDDFIMFNDDFILTRPVTDWVEFCNVYRGTLWEKECEYIRLDNPNEWQRGFHDTRQLCILCGVKDEPLDYELHHPVIFNRELRLNLFKLKETQRFRYISDPLIFQRSLYLNLYPDKNPPKRIFDRKLFGDIIDSSFTDNGCFSVTSHLIGNHKRAPRLHQWLETTLSQKCIFER